MSGPWRDVAYIGVQLGDHGGKAWALVLDECGHTVFKSMPPFRLGPALALRGAQHGMRSAPRRVRCYHCGLGHAPLSLDEALATARRTYDGSLETI